MRVQGVEDDEDVLAEGGWVEVEARSGGCLLLPSCLSDSGCALFHTSWTRLAAARRISMRWSRDWDLKMRSWICGCESNILTCGAGGR